MLNIRTGPHKIRLANVGAIAWLARIRFRWSIRRRIERYRNRVAHHSYGGHDLAISLEDPVAEQWYDHDWPLTPELACLGQSRLKPGARVFDLGAHQAVVALIISRLVGPQGRVVALEAERHNFDVASRNKALNDAGNLEVVHAAAGGEDGWLNFTGGLNGSVVTDGGLGGARTRSRTVDSLAEEHGPPDVVFIDVEGFEHEVLRGAEKTLEAGMTDFFVEVHVGYGLEDLGGSAQEIVDYFGQPRYNVLVSPARGELEQYELGSLEGRAGLLAERFFLVALAVAS
jgi:FkbM family methyltransferase